MRIGELPDLKIPAVNLRENKVTINEVQKTGSGGWSILAMTQALR